VVTACLRKAFSIYGLPDVIGSDNATCFHSAEYSEFLHSLGIKAMYSAPYYPQANGPAEKAVQTLKEALQRVEGPNDERLLHVLGHHRTTPGPDGKTPAERLMGRQPTTLLDRLRPRPETSSPPEQPVRTPQTANSFQVYEKLCGDLVCASTHISHTTRIVHTDC
jgi:hypothetical protein